MDELSAEEFADRSGATAEQLRRLVELGTITSTSGEVANMGLEAPRRQPARTAVPAQVHGHGQDGSGSGFHELDVHSGQGPALQAGDVHLGAADLGRDLVLVQVLEEPQDDHLTFQRWEG
jgi:hypothetical protein